MPKTGKNSACKKTAIATRQLIESSPLQPTAGSRYWLQKRRELYTCFVCSRTGKDLHRNGARIRDPPPKVARSTPPI